MKKPYSLRNYLVENIKFLQDNPQNLSMYIESGRYRSTMVTGLSMESICPLKLVIQDFTGDPDLIAFLIYQWLRTHQSELMTNLETNKNAVKFELEVIDNDKCDLMFELELTERVIVKKQADGSYTFDYPPEPQYEPVYDSIECQMVNDAGEVLATWQSADANGAVSLTMPFSK